MSLTTKSETRLNDQKMYQEFWKLDAFRRELVSQSSDSCEDVFGLECTSNQRIMEGIVGFNHVDIAGWVLSVMI